MEHRDLSTAEPTDVPVQDIAHQSDGETGTAAGEGAVGSSVEKCHVNSAGVAVATSKPSWHVPTPQQVVQMKQILSMLSSKSPSVPAEAVAKQAGMSPEAKQSIFVPGLRPTSAVSDTAQALAVSAVNTSLGYDSSSSSSSSSDSSDESSSDDEASPAGNKFVLVGSALPMQLRMECTVKLEKMNLYGMTTITVPSTSSGCVSAISTQSPNIDVLLPVKSEPLSPSDSDTSFDLFPHRPTINTVKESRARPLSKIKTATKVSSPLLKVKAAKPVEPMKTEPDVLDMLQSCRACKVRLVDCWRGRPLPAYIKIWQSNPYIYSDEEQVIEKRMKKKKKKDKDKDKGIKREVDYEFEKPSRTKHKKMKVKSERKRVVLENSSDEDVRVSPRKYKRESEVESSDSHKHHRADMVKQLVDRKSGSKVANEAQAKKEPAVKKEPRPISSYVSPWGEAVATAGMPKIPKIKKIQNASGSYVPASQQQMASNFRQVETPLERLQKREARRRDFEKNAAMRYGGQSQYNSYNPPPSNPYSADMRQQRHPSQQGQPNPYGQPNQVTTSATSTMSLSPATPTYQIPNPPIPGRLSEISNDAIAPKPVAPPPLDPRAMMSSLPDSLFTPPAPIIPAKPKITPLMSISEPKSIFQAPNSNLPDAAQLFAEPDSLLPDPSAAAQPAHNVVTAFPSSLSRTSTKKSRALLPEPDSLLPVPSSLLPPRNALLPVPQALLPDPVTSPSSSDSKATQKQHEQFRCVLDEDDWKIISQPSAPINKLKSSLDETEMQGWSNEYKRRDDRKSNEERSHQKMPADSTSTDDPPFDQGVLDEICRLSLEITKRMAKTASDEQEPALIPLESEQHSGREFYPDIPKDIPLSDDSQIMCYDYAHSHPPLPEDYAPLPTSPAPRAPTPPPNLNPPPMPPSLLGSRFSLVDNDMMHHYPETGYMPHNHDNYADRYSSTSVTGRYSKGPPPPPPPLATDPLPSSSHLRPVLSRHFDDNPPPSEESYEDILAYEQERTRKEMYYEELRRSAGQRAQDVDSYDVYNRHDEYDSGEARRDHDDRQLDHGTHHSRDQEGVSRLQEDEREDEYHRYEEEQRRLQRAREEFVRDNPRITRDRYGLPVVNSDDFEGEANTATPTADSNIDGEQALKSSNITENTQVNNNLDNTSQPGIAKTTTAVQAAAAHDAETNVDEYPLTAETGSIVGEAPMDLDEEDSDEQVDIARGALTQPPNPVPLLGRTGQGITTSSIIDSLPGLPSCSIDTYCSLPVASASPIFNASLVNSSVSGGIVNSSVLSISSTSMLISGAEGVFSTPSTSTAVLAAVTTVPTSQVWAGASADKLKMPSLISTAITKAISTSNVVALPRPLSPPPPIPYTYSSRKCVSTITTALSVVAANKSEARTPDLSPQSLQLPATTWPVPVSAIPLPLEAIPLPPKKEELSCLKLPATVAASLLSVYASNEPTHSSKAILLPDGKENASSVELTGVPTVRPLSEESFVSSVTASEKTVLSTDSLATVESMLSIPLPSENVQHFASSTASLISTSSTVNSSIAATPAVATITPFSTTDTVRPVTLPAKTRSPPVGIASVFRSGLATELTPIETAATEANLEESKDMGSVYPELSDKQTALSQPNAPSLLSQIAATLTAINTIVAQTSSTTVDPPTAKDTKLEKYIPRPKSKQLKYKKHKRASQSSKSTDISSHEADKANSSGSYAHSNSAEVSGEKSETLDTDPRQSSSVVSVIENASGTMSGYTSANISAVIAVPNIVKSELESVPTDNTVTPQTDSSDKIEVTVEAKADIKTFDGAKMDSLSNIHELPTEALQTRLAYLTSLVKHKPQAPIPQTEIASSVKSVTEMPRVATTSTAAPESSLPPNVEEKGIPLSIMDAIKGISPSLMSSLRSAVAGSVQNFTSENEGDGRCEPPKHKNDGSVGQLTGEIEGDDRSVLPEAVKESKPTDVATGDSTLICSESEAADVSAQRHNAMLSCSEPVMQTSDAPITREEEEIASFFGKLGSGTRRMEDMGDVREGIPGLTVVDDELTAEDYELKLGKPKYQYPLSVPELSEELSSQIKIILENTSSSAVLKALVRVCVLHNTEKFTFTILKNRNPELTDISSIYNKALINFLSHDDMFRLVTAAGMQQCLPELELHPMVRQLLQKVYEEMTAGCT